MATRCARYRNPTGNTLSNQTKKQPQPTTPHSTAQKKAKTSLPTHFELRNPFTVANPNPVHTTTTPHSLAPRLTLTSYQGVGRAFLRNDLFPLCLLACLPAQVTRSFFSLLNFFLFSFFFFPFPFFFFFFFIFFFFFFYTSHGQDKDETIQREKEASAISLPWLGLRGASLAVR
ncbi:hypothetical protein HOY80DRAFT_723747 [Tuber brumale]|nr:hypothetical protein HOY80DRAFT_723747 [Tuber brumale]